MTLNEKRRSPRYLFVSSFNMTTMSEARHGVTEIPNTAESVNISEEGIMVWTRGIPPRKDSIVKIRLMINGLLVSVPVLTRVKWIHEHSPGIHRAGLQFIG